MIKYYKIANQKLLECSATEESGVLLYIDPNAAEMTELIQQYHIDDHDVHSCLDPNELSRLAFEDDYILLIIKRPENYSAMDNLLFKVNSAGIFLMKNKLIIVMGEDVQLLDGKQFTKVNALHDIFIKILYVTISHFLGHLQVINMMSDELEQKINTSMSNKYLLNMFILEKSLVYYLDGISSNTKVIDKLKNNAAKIGFTPDNVEMLDDIIIENQQCQKQAEIYLNILTGLMDARGSIVGNNLSLLIKRLTIVNIIFMPLNLLAGMGGMSEYSMMTSGIPWWIAYPAFLLGLMLLGALTYFVMNKFIKKVGQEE